MGFDGRWWGSMKVLCGNCVRVRFHFWSVMFLCDGMERDEFWIDVGVDWFTICFRLIEISSPLLLTTQASRGSFEFSPIVSLFDLMNEKSLSCSKVGCFTFFFKWLKISPPFMDNASVSLINFLFYFFNCGSWNEMRLK